jgi:hypothetical protein
MGALQSTPKDEANTWDSVIVCTSLCRLCKQLSNLLCTLTGSLTGRELDSRNYRCMVSNHSRSPCTRVIPELLLNGLDGQSKIGKVLQVEIIVFMNVRYMLCLSHTLAHLRSLYLDLAHLLSISLVPLLARSPARPVSCSPIRLPSLPLTLSPTLLLSCSPSCLPSCLPIHSPARLSSCLPSPPLAVSHSPSCLPRHVGRESRRELVTCSMKPVT